VRSAIFGCTISTAVVVCFMPQIKYCSRVSKDAFERLEPCGSKDPCTALRELGAGNRVWLPDSLNWRGYFNIKRVIRTSIRMFLHPSYLSYLLSVSIRSGK
jgi:hypothetical protein